jgi:hypothetical protein
MRSIKHGFRALISDEEADHSTFRPHREPSFGAENGRELHLIGDCCQHFNESTALFAASRSSVAESLHAGWPIS